MIKNKLLVIISIFFLGLIPIGVFGMVTVDLNIKPSFGLGENISFNYSIISDKDIEISFIPFIECPSAPVAPLVERTINLTKNILYVNNYYGGKVEDWFEPQTCTAHIRVISPFKQIEEKNFKISKMFPTFNFNISTCRDLACSNKTKNFVKTNYVYLDYTSDISNPIIIATLTYPDKTTEDITLPYSLKAEQIGTYNLKATASKEGYKNTTENIQFAVIAKEAEINERVICNGNGICDSEENSQNCPQDCVLNISRENMEGKSNGSERIITRRSKVSSMYIFLAIIIILIILIFAFIRPKRKTLAPIKKSDQDNMVVGWDIGK